MRISIELNEELIDAIAQVKSTEDSFDRISDAMECINEAYAIAFADGAKFILKLINESKKHE